MLERVLRYINNRFDRDSKGRPYGSCVGTFVIENGSLEVDGLLEGQYFWVEGSVLNDGLHLYPDNEMRDETFTGRVVFLVIPRDVVEISEEIADWNAANAPVVTSPLKSESFGGYSYTRVSGSSEGSEMPLEAWMLQFGARLRPFRKLDRDWV